MHLAAEYRYSRLQCVPYAREVSHIDLSGDAFLWWAEASGRYARGNTPVVGAVLNFRSIGRMPLGHVAVVTAVLNPRTILVTQANWVPGSITNDVTVQDVSPDNNWTDVRVELGDSATMGAAYPTYGFIYNRPAIGTVIASANGVGNEVAEAPQARPVASEAPDRNLQ
ncbi:MAG: CHAP domain-containing protein [Rhodospirillales bacterium]|nr:CHAP domain-containing protein [Rhodospirillales bacterium]MDE1883940.1 CHAP domain-containing protein [Rhodospirillales bacterium]MDE2390815.1 CHAP domain-containing protein [Rhodospirillales bacterium]